MVSDRAEAIGAVRQTHAFQNLQRHLTRRFECQVIATEACADRYIFQHRHAVQRFYDLMGARYAEVDDFIRRTIGDVLAGEADLSRVQFVNPVHHVEEGRLTRAIRADQPQDLALRESEGHVRDGQQPAEALGDTFDFQQGGHSITFSERGTRR